MNHHRLLLLASLLLVSFSSALADTPAKIAEDYRKAAAAALTKLNGTLEQATAPLMAALVKEGDTAGAEELRAQLKAKIAGEPVVKPQAGAVLLFAQYDQARTKALEPALDAAVGRIDAMLSGSEGKNIDTITELGKVREEIEVVRMTASTALPVEWTYHQKLNAGNTAEIFLLPNGIMEFHEQSGVIKKGSWKRAKTGVVVYFLNEEWKLNLSGDVASFERPQVGTRYMKVKVAAK